MKHKLPVFAIMLVSSKLTLAEAANDPLFDPSGTRGADVVPALEADWGDPVVHPDLADTTAVVSDDLQDKLDGGLYFEMVPRDPDDPEFAGTD